MANPIQKAGELRDLLSKLLETINIAAAPRKKIEDALNQTTDIISVLEFINENVVPLEIEETLTKSLDLWNELEPGFTRRNDPKLESLIEKSATLDTLTRAGVEIKSIAKFGKTEFDLAQEIGDNFQDRHWALQKFKTALQNGKTSFKAQIIDYRPYKAFFDVMKKFNLVSQYETKVLTDEENNVWEKLNPAELREFKRFHPIRFSFTPMDKTLNGLISGNWFNAYAYQIISKHLLANRYNFELFTRIAYQAPRDIIRSDGDFDIIGKIENHLLFVECKSGKLAMNGSYEEVKKVVEKTEDLKQVFKQSNTDITEFIFLMIYNPLLPENKTIPESIASDIRTVKPFEIRGTINSLFKRKA